MVGLGGETLLERAVRVAVEAGLEPVFVVISAGQDVAFGVDKPGWLHRCW